MYILQFKNVHCVRFSVKMFKKKKKDLQNKNSGSVTDKINFRSQDSDIEVPLVSTCDKSSTVY